MIYPIDNLPNDINGLKQIIIRLQQELQAQQQAQLEELNLYQRQRFGRSAEPHPPQGEVFNEAEAEAETPVDADTFCDNDACEPEPSENTAAHGATADADTAQARAPHEPKKRRPRLPPNLPREEVIVRLPPEEQVCDSCNQPMHVMGKEVREELELIPAHVRVTRYIREKYGCRCCEQQGTTGSVNVAPPVPAGGIIRRARHPAAPTDAEPVVAEGGRTPYAAACADAGGAAVAGGHLRQ